jgi:hypothetical protein
MKQYAIPRDGAAPEIVDEVIVVDGRQIPLSERFHPHVVAQMVPYDAQSAAPPTATPTLESLKHDLRQAATLQRRNVEWGGILFDGMRIATGKDDQDRITSVAVHAQPAGLQSFDFKTADGWITADLATLQEIATVVARHVQACFSVERTHHEAIDAITTATAALAYDIYTGWPA